MPTASLKQLRRPLPAAPADDSATAAMNDEPPPAPGPSFEEGGASPPSPPPPVEEEAAASFRLPRSTAPAPASSEGTASPARGQKRASDASEHPLPSPSGASTDRQAFLYSLYDILSMPHACTPASGARYESIVSWLPHGRGFVIGDKPRFEKEVLPAFLPHTKYASFTRRLKRWKFVRVSSGIEMGSYYHPYFQRGKPHLIHLINTTDVPVGQEYESLVPPYQAYPSGGSERASSSHKKKKKGDEPHHPPKLFADIRLPYADFGAATTATKRAPLDDGAAGASTATATTAAKASDDAGAAREDVRDFPQLMRKISKAKRREARASKRRRDELGPSGAAGLDAASATAMGVGGAMVGAGYPLPYASASMMGAHHADLAPGVASAAASAAGFPTPRYPPAPAAEVADAMMAQLSQPLSYRARYWEAHHPSAASARMGMMGEGSHLGGGPAAWHPTLAGMTLGEREALWRRQQIEGGMGGMGSPYAGGGGDAAGGDSATALGSSRLPPSPNPTPPLGASAMGSAAGRGSAAYAYPSYPRPAMAAMYGGAGMGDPLPLSDAEREWLLRRELMQRPDPPSDLGEKDE